MSKRPIQRLLDRRPGIVVTQPTSDTDTTYIYRGADLETMRNQILNKGRIPGTTSDILEDSPRELYEELNDRPYIEELTWLEDTPNLPADFKQVPVTGGVTDNIGATRRFRDRRGLIAVMDSSKTNFEKAEYTYEWMDEHPGVLTQILTTSDGEVRVPGKGLWGILDKAVFLSKPDRYVIEHWQPENLPATSPDSMFAQEDEWFAAESPTSIADAFEGLVSVTSEDSVKFKARDHPGPIDEDTPPRKIAPVLYLDLQKKLGAFKEPFFMLVFKGKGTSEDYSFDRSDMAFAMTPTGIVEPGDVPQKFLGNR